MPDVNAIIMVSDAYVRFSIWLLNTTSHCPLHAALKKNV